MSELKQKIRSDLTASMKARDKSRTGALRMLMAAIQAEEVAGAKAKELTDTDVLRVVGREVKKRRDSLTVYREAGRDDLADKEAAEIEVLQEYQPSQLSDEEVKSLVEQVISEYDNDEPTMADMGKLMPLAIKKADGAADNGRLNAEIRRQLQG